MEGRSGARVDLQRKANLKRQQGHATDGKLSELGWASWQAGRPVKLSTPPATTLSARKALTHSKCSEPPPWPWSSQSYLPMMRNDGELGAIR